MVNRNGILLVIDGSDGSGKATQTKLLVERFEREGYRVKTMSFPQYENNFFGLFIGECLKGAHGDFLAVDPYIASLAYAADRWESKEAIERWLEDGYVIILDRYVSSNQMHQGAKIADEAKRQQFLRWLDTMEHEVFKIPRPDAILYLHVEIQLTLSLLRQADARKKKSYLKEGEVDQVEGNIEHLQSAQESALRLIAENNQWYRIHCSPEKTLKRKEEVHEMIVSKVHTILGARLDACKTHAHETQTQTLTW